MKVRLLAPEECLETAQGEVWDPHEHRGQKAVIVRREAGHVIEHHMAHLLIELGKAEPVDEEAQFEADKIVARRRAIAERRKSAQRLEYERVQAQNRAAFARELGVADEADEAEEPDASEESGVRAPTRLAGGEE